MVESPHIALKRKKWVSLTASASEILLSSSKHCTHGCMIMAVPLRIPFSHAAFRDVVGAMCLGFIEIPIAALPQRIFLAGAAS